MDEDPVKDETPTFVAFFPNGMAAVCNKDGQQIFKFNGRHAHTVAALKEAGFDWMTLPEVLGVPRK